jgi:hypothetical protein
MAAILILKSVKKLICALLTIMAWKSSRDLSNRTSYE